MNDKEHDLMIAMFAKQAEMMMAILQLLRSRGLNEGDDFAAFQTLVRDQERRTHELLRHTARQYVEFADRSGVTVAEEPDRTHPPVAPPSPQS